MKRDMRTTGKKTKSNIKADSVHALGPEASKKPRRSSSRSTWASGLSIAEVVGNKKGCIAISAFAMSSGTNAPFIGWTLRSTILERPPRGKMKAERI